MMSTYLVLLALAATLMPLVAPAAQSDFTHVEAEKDERFLFPKRSTWTQVNVVTSTTFKFSSCLSGIDLGNPCTRRRRRRRSVQLKHLANQEPVDEVKIMPSMQNHESADARFFFLTINTTEQSTITVTTTSYYNSVTVQISYACSYPDLLPPAC